MFSSVAIAQEPASKPGKKKKWVPAARMTAMQPAVKDPKILRERLEKKLAKPFVKKAPWVLDYEAALAAAKREKKLLFAYFTRSYAG